LWTFKIIERRKIKCYLEWINFDQGTALPSSQSKRKRDKRKKKEKEKKERRKMRIPIFSRAFLRETANNVTFCVFIYINIYKYIYE